MPIDFAAIRAQFPLTEYCQQRGIILHRSGHNWTGKCPLHQERHGQSFVIFNDRWTCFGKCGRRGDIIDLEQALGGGSLHEAIQRLSGTLPSLPPPTPNRVASKSSSKMRWPWPKLLRLGTTDELSQLATQRAISLKACQLAQDRGLLRFLTHREGVAWVVTDQLCENGVARLLGARPWTNGAKAKTLPGSCAKRPIGILEAINFPNVAIVEGGPDLLAAFHFMLECGTEQQVAPICMASACAEFLPGDLGHLRGKAIRLFPHADQKGHQAAHCWFRQVKTVSTALDIIDFRELTKSDDADVKDLNDLASGSRHEELDRFMVFEGRQNGRAQRSA